MSLPEFIEAHNIPTGNSTPNGIITALKSQVSNVLTYVVPTSNTETAYGNISNVVTWNGMYQTSSIEGAYVQIEFKDRYVFATHYSLKGYGSNYWCYAKQWYVYGFNSVGETPTLIITHTSEGSTFCGYGRNCVNDNWGTFAIPNPSKSYRFLRIQVKEQSCSTSYIVVMLGGFEVFGVYSKDIRYTINPIKRRTFCFNSYPVTLHYPVLYIFKAILISS
jgi:hypothetical protein